MSILVSALLLLTIPLLLGWIALLAIDAIARHMERRDRE